MSENKEAALASGAEALSARVEGAGGADGVGDLWRPVSATG